MSDADKPVAVVDGTLVEEEDPAPVFARRGRTARPLDPGRLGVYAALGGASGVVPLPWLPDILARRVRGALVQDIARRHGMSLPRESREVLSEPSGTEGPRGVIAQVGGFVATKVLARLGPIAVLSPVKAGLQTFALGHLFHRYLEVGRTEHSRRVEVVEARRVRRAIDQALVAVVTVEMRAATESGETLPGDDRDALTAFIDRLISRTAGVPGWLVLRLEAAFDERFPQVDG